MSSSIDYDPFDISSIALPARRNPKSPTITREKSVVTSPCAPLVSSEQPMASGFDNIISHVDAKETSVTLGSTSPIVLKETASPPSTAMASVPNHFNSSGGDINESEVDVPVQQPAIIKTHFLSDVPILMSPSPPQKEQHGPTSTIKPDKQKLSAFQGLNINGFDAFNMNPLKTSLVSPTNLQSHISPSSTLSATAVATAAAANTTDFTSFASPQPTELDVFSSKSSTNGFGAFEISSAVVGAFESQGQAILSETLPSNNPMPHHISSSFPIPHGQDHQVNFPPVQPSAKTTSSGFDAFDFNPSFSYSFNPGPSSAAGRTAQSPQQRSYPQPSGFDEFGPPSVDQSAFTSSMYQPAVNSSDGALVMSQTQLPPATYAAYVPPSGAQSGFESSALAKAGTHVTPFQDERGLVSVHELSMQPHPTVNGSRFDSSDDTTVGSPWAVLSASDLDIFDHAPSAFTQPQLHGANNNNRNNNDASLLPGEDDFDDPFNSPPSDPFNGGSSAPVKRNGRSEKDIMAKFRQAYDLPTPSDGDSTADNEIEEDDDDDYQAQWKTGSKGASPEGSRIAGVAARGGLKDRDEEPHFGHPSGLMEGKVYARLSALELFTKGWHEMYWRIEGDLLLIFNEKGDKTPKKKIMISHSLRVQHIKQKEYRGLGNVFNFMLEEALDFGVVFVAKFASSSKLPVELLWMQLRQQIALRRQKVSVLS